MPTERMKADACAKIVRALVVEGQSPMHHRRALAKLRREWPVLYAGLAALVRAEGHELPPHGREYVGTGCLTCDQRRPNASA